MKILIAGHGELAAELVNSARMIGGERPELHSVGLLPEDTPQSFRDRMLAHLGDFPADLILTDLAGGTPDNVANLIAKAGHIPSVRLIVAGASLPLLLEFALGGDVIADLDPEEVISETGAVIRFRS